MVWKTKKKNTLHCKINKLTYFWVIGYITAFKEVEPLKRGEKLAKHSK